RDLALPCAVRAERIETAAPALGRCDVVTARALAPLPALLELAAPLLKTGALGLFMKGERLEAELTDSSLADRYDLVTEPSRTQAGAVIVKARAKGV
ncbi:MAG: class I SAM-dependent methyltransferase, partial [Methylobacteriaceae bacterium]|nr:class I SAM-dependent methyltransferase [Methylobacteriaceae bacterium]